MAKYFVEVVNVPECSGSRLTNSYVALLENGGPYDHVIININRAHTELTADLQTAIDKLAQNDPVCGYFEATTGDDVEELLEKYRETYEAQDLKTIQTILKEL